MRVLVTGHHGYIGSVMVPVLEAAGAQVTGVDTFFYDGCALKGAGSAPTGPRRDVREVSSADLEGFDAIVHLAALSNDPLGEMCPTLTDAINFRATVALAKAAKRAGVSRFVFASSCSMYGASNGERAVDERVPLAPLTEYARSKARCEVALTALADDAFSPVMMRNGTVYGVSPRLRLDLVLNNLVAWAHTTGKIRILSDGTPWRPLVHVQDIASATLALLSAPRDLIHGEAFNIGAPDENYQVRQVAEIVHETVPECSLEIAGEGGSDHRSYRVDFSKFVLTFPEFEYAWTVRSGARELVDAYERVDLTLEEFEGDAYSRINRLRRLLDEGLLDKDLRWQEQPTQQREGSYA